MYKSPPCCKNKSEWWIVWLLMILSQWYIVQRQRKLYLGMTKKLQFRYLNLAYEYIVQVPRTAFPLSPSSLVSPQLIYHCVLSFWCYCHLSRNAHQLMQSVTISPLSMVDVFDITIDICHIYYHRHFHSYIYSLIHSFIHPFIHSFINSSPPPSSSSSSSSSSSPYHHYHHFITIVILSVILQFVMSSLFLVIAYNCSQCWLMQMVAREKKHLCADTLQSVSLFL